MALTNFVNGTVVNPTFLNKVDKTTEAITSSAGTTWIGQKTSVAAAITSSGFWGSSGNTNITPNTNYLKAYPTVTDFEGFASVLDIPSGSTVINMSAIGGFISNRNAISGIERNGVCLFGQGTAEVNNAATWGVNTLLQDNSTRAIGALTGVILANEFDFNVMCPGTTVIGLGLGGNSLSTPTVSNALQISALGTGIPWQTAITTYAGAATYALVVGQTSTAAATVASQKILMQWYDSGSTPRSHQLQVSGAGVWKFTNIDSSIQNTMELISDQTFNGFTVKTVTGASTVAELYGVSAGNVDGTLNLYRSGIKEVLLCSNTFSYIAPASGAANVAIGKKTDDGVNRLQVAGHLSLTTSSVYKINNVQVVAARDTGWSAMTGTANKATVYDTATVTLAQLAGRVMSLQAALTTHGLIGT